MKSATLIGIVLACAGLLLGAVLEGTPVGSFVNLPAMLIIFGGVLGATLASAGLEEMRKIPALYRRVFNTRPSGPDEDLAVFVGWADVARRDGLLSLEDAMDDTDDPFKRKGLQLVIDGNDPELVREILEGEIESMRARHKLGQDTFRNAAGYAPTMGIIGTVMGLISVLQQLDSPQALGPAISVAFVATLLGVGAANVVFLPVAQRLKQLSDDEVESRYLAIEGLLAVQAGDNPRLVGERLLSFVPPARREAAREGLQPRRLQAVGTPADEAEREAA